MWSFSTYACVCGLALGLSGLALIRRAWLNRQNRHLATMASGWGMIVISVFPLVYAIGGDFGVTIAFIAPTLGAFVMLSMGLLTPLPDAPQKRSCLPKPQPERRWIGSLRTTAVIALSGPVALSVALLATMIVFQVALISGWSDADALFTAMIIMPIAWALTAVFGALKAPLRWRTGLLISFALILGGACYALMSLSN